jgi:hypothetical protein
MVPHPWSPPKRLRLAAAVAAAVMAARRAKSSTG